MNQICEAAGPTADLIEARSSPIHGDGLFAVKTISPGTRIVEYRGEAVTKSESIKRCAEGNDYLFVLNEESDLDGNVPWNPARLVNHSCAPNCDAELIEGRIFLVARRNIAAGEELSFNYGYDLMDYREHPCRCGEPNCVGYMVHEELFPLIQERQMAAAISEGETLGRPLK